MKWILVLLFLIPFTAHAGEGVMTRTWTEPSRYSLFEAKELSLDLRKVSIKRDPYYVNKDDWYSYVGLNWDISILSYMFWDNKVFFYGDRAQVRKIGWHYDMGIRVTNQIDFYWHHESEHDADHDKADPDFPERGRFPIENSYGVRLKFLKK